MGNKIVLKGYTVKPMIEEKEDGVLSIAAGDPCDGTPAEPGSSGDGEGESASSLAKTALSVALPVVLGVGAGLPFSATAAAATAFGAFANAPRAAAQTVSECELAPIEGKSENLVQVFLVSFVQRF